MLDRFFERNRIAGRRVPKRPAMRLRGRGVGDVAGDLQIDRLAASQRRFDGGIDLAGCFGWILNHNRIGGHAQEDVPLIVVVDLADCVMQQLVFGCRVRIGASGDRDQGKIFSARARHRVKHAEAAHAEGNYHRRGATGRAGVSISRVAGVEFVAAADHLELGVLEQLIKQHKVIVARHGEIVP